MTTEMDRLTKMVDYWKPLLGLGQWDFTLEVVDHLKKAPKHSVANCDAHWQYRIATIKVLRRYLIGATDAELKATVVHELNHCVTNEFESYAVDSKHGERVVVDITAIVLNFDRLLHERRKSNE